MFAPLKVLLLIADFCDFFLLLTKSQVPGFVLVFGSVRSSKGENGMSQSCLLKCRRRGEAHVRSISFAKATRSTAEALT